MEKCPSSWMYLNLSVSSWQMSKITNYKANPDLRLSSGGRAPRQFFQISGGRLRERTQWGKPQSLHWNGCLLSWWRRLLLSMVLITAEGDITKDRSDPASAHKTALNRAGREKPVFDCCRKPIKHTHIHTHEPPHTHIHTQRRASTSQPPPPPPPSPLGISLRLNSFRLTFIIVR